MSSGVTTEELSDLPGSAKLVYATLVHHGPTRYTELRARTGLSSSGVYTGLDALEARGLVGSRACDHDLRGTEYIAFG